MNVLGCFFACLGDALGGRGVRTLYLAVRPINGLLSRLTCASNLAVRSSPRRPTCGDRPIGLLPSLRDRGISCLPRLGYGSIGPLPRLHHCLLGLLADLNHFGIGGRTRISDRTVSPLLRLGDGFLSLPVSSGHFGIGSRTHLSNRTVSMLLRLGDCFLRLLAGSGDGGVGALACFGDSTAGLALRFSDFGGRISKHPFKLTADLLRYVFGSLSFGGSFDSALRCTRLGSANLFSGRGYLRSGVGTDLVDFRPQLLDCLGCDLLFCRALSGPLLSPRFCNARLFLGGGERDLCVRAALRELSAQLVDNPLVCSVIDLALLLPVSGFGLDLSDPFAGGRGLSPGLHGFLPR